jgi:hypothetical protein
MEVIHGKPYVMVTVNGRGPFRFIVDTGTGGDAIITTELATQLGLPVAGEARLSDPSGMGGQTAPLRLIDTLVVAGIDFNDIKAIEHSLPVGEGTCQGMLGFTLFRDFLLTLDYVNGRLVLAEGELQPDGDKSVLSFKMPDGVPIARLTIGSHQVDAQIDSGGAGLSLPAVSLDALSDQGGQAGQRRPAGRHHPRPAVGGDQSCLSAGQLRLLPHAALHHHFRPGEAPGSPRWPAQAHHPGSDADSATAHLPARQCGGTGAGAGGVRTVCVPLRIGIGVVER